MSDTVVICGAGVSAEYCRWEWDTPIMAVSSGFDRAATFKHFATLDRPICYPPYIADGTTFDKHVPDGKFARFWQVHPNVRIWKYSFDETEPNFTRPDQPLARGEPPRNDSLLFGVQVAAHLGYRRMIFLGVDLNENDRWPTNDELRRWWPQAKEAGLTWENASPVSMLQCWMPTCRSGERLVIA
jgi:hypothetical protein